MPLHGISERSALASVNLGTMFVVAAQGAHALDLVADHQAQHGHGGKEDDVPVRIFEAAGTEELGNHQGDVDGHRQGRCQHDVADLEPEP